MTIFLCILLSLFLFSIIMLYVEKRVDSKIYGAVNDADDPELNAFLSHKDLCFFRTVLSAPGPLYVGTIGAGAQFYVNHFVTDSNRKVRSRVYRVSRGSDKHKAIEKVWLEKGGPKLKRTLHLF